MLKKIAYKIGPLSGILILCVTIIDIFFENNEYLKNLKDILINIIVLLGLFVFAYYINKYIHFFIKLFKK